MTISVTENTDGTFTIDWDQEDPQESLLNSWTEEDFINAIENKLKSLEELGEADNATEAINQVTEYFIDQTPEEVQQDLRNIEAFIRKDEGDDRLPRLFF
jgi:hypothetical protein